MHSVVIVDDHLLIAKAISSMVNAFDNFKVLYEVENGIYLQEKFKSPANIPNIILLDISMPVMDGFETALWLKNNYPQILVMALSMQDDEHSILNMVKNGAKGYMVKNSHPSELELALSTLVRTKIYFPSWATSILMHSLNAEGDPKSDEVKLTDREREFLSFVCTELTYKEIADKMFCSPRTVEGYRDTLFEKLNVHTRVGLAMISIKLKICKV
jgi:DNA-binding NarL/FixJ family response regulator